MSGLGIRGEFGSEEGSEVDLLGKRLQSVAIARAFGKRQKVTISKKQPSRGVLD